MKEEIISLLYIVGRSVAVYVFVLFVIRLLGKKELSQLSTPDIVLLLLISNAVQNAMVGPDTSLAGGLCAAAVLILVNLAFKKALYRSKSFRALIDQKPEILIHNGNLEIATLAKLEITNDELMEAMREHGVEFYNQVKWAMLEMDGTISIITNDQGQLKQSVYKRRKIKRNILLNS